MEWIYVSIYISNAVFNLYYWLLSLRLKIFTFIIVIMFKYK